MVPSPSYPFTWDYWTSSASESVELTCLMPNSIYIPLRLSWDATLLNVKELLWHRAASNPLFGMLYQTTSYMFQFINSLAVVEEVDDESKRIRDIKPVLGVLIIIKKSKGTPEEHLLNTHISNLIGKGLNEFDALSSPEVQDFRMEMRYLAEQNFIKRKMCTPEERLLYQYPPRLDPQPGIPKTLKSHLCNNIFLITTSEDKSGAKASTWVKVDETPSTHIRQFIKSKKNKELSDEQLKKYVLKVHGREEYLLEDRPWIQYLYIQEKLSVGEVPQVLLVNIDNLNLAIPVDRDISNFYSTASKKLSFDNTNNTIRKNPHVSSWDIEKNYSCTVESVRRLNVDTGTQPVEVMCQVGIYHGGKAICEAQTTGVAGVTEAGAAQWDERLEFPIKVQNVPRMARLCFVIYEVNKIKGRKRKDCINKLAWVNTMIFDYKDELCNKREELQMWTPVADETQGEDLLLHPLGTVVPNPNIDACATLQIRFSDYDCELPIMFPTVAEVRSYAEQMESYSLDAKPVLRDLKELCDAAEKDPMYEMHEQEKKDLWAAREYFRVSAPELLPKLITCVEWSDRAEAAGALALLDAWRLQRVETALELLDYAYADAHVRSFAVKHLDDISNQDLLLYLLQLVQALKHEPYLMCDLTKFLLQRAFNNMTIGHYLFWHLRSEMQVSYVTVRFGLILEAYCRGCQDHISILMKQITCLEKLKWVTKMVKQNRDLTKARKVLKKHLQEPHCKEALRDFVSPLNPSFVCGSLKVEECTVMDSKKRPLLLEFENAVPGGDAVRIILKIGDDLRQDMFTLQMLRIMDRLWKNAGYDFRLCPYNCISMDTSASAGMIEVVDQAATIATIQKANAINKTLLYNWLKEEKTEDSLNKAIEEFTMSCAGYCVATYVLGIADRHSDNIMLRRNGQLFHIDFGHFLGHFKHKFGFKRERVPFVLTRSFIYVINKAQRVSEPIEFSVFRTYCETAFQILRKHGHLILSLFSMMISTGLPELNSEKDLQYLRDTLVLDLSEQKALEHFRSKFTEATKKAWTTTFDWVLRNCDRNN